jgi:hypothetical protein
MSRCLWVSSCRRCLGFAEGAASANPPPPPLCLCRRTERLSHQQQQPMRTVSVPSPWRQSPALIAAAAAAFLEVSHIKKIPENRCFSNECTFLVSHQLSDVILMGLGGVMLVLLAFLLGLAFAYRKKARKVCALVARGAQMAASMSEALGAEEARARFEKVGYVAQRTQVLFGSPGQESSDPDAISVIPE